jgi:hypothetical protein
MQLVRRLGLMNNLRFHVWFPRKVVSRLDVELLKSFVADCHRLFTIDSYRGHIDRPEQRTR